MDPGGMGRHLPPVRAGAGPLHVVVPEVRRARTPCITRIPLGLIEPPDKVDPGRRRESDHVVVDELRRHGGEQFGIPAAFGLDHNRNDVVPTRITLAKRLNFDIRAATQPRARYQVISSGKLPDQISRNCENAR